MVDQLYNTLRDRDPEVVANCIVALNRILLSEGGMTIDTNIAHYLLQRLHEFNEWHQCLVLDTLIRYKPSSEDEKFDIMASQKLFFKINDIILSINLRIFIINLESFGRSA